MLEKSRSEHFSGHEQDVLPPNHGWSRTSFMAPSTRSSSFLENIKHDLMVNYLYHQQCLRRWVTDSSGEIEGVLLRKTRGEYLACPPSLGQSRFAHACAALNVQVWLALLSITQLLSVKLTRTVRHDRQLPSHSLLPGLGP